MLENDSRKLFALSMRRHPLYSQNLPHWEFMEMCYEGGREWFAPNIFKYHKEGFEEYGDRVKRAYRFNHTRECVDLVNKYLFRAKPLRNIDDASESVKKFWQDSSRRDQSIDEFVKVVSQKTSVFGRVYVVVDSSLKSSDGVTTLSDEADSKIYAYVVSPIHVLDMSWGDDNKLNWILIRELKRDDADPLASSGRIKQRYRLWTRTHWYLIDAGQEAASSGQMLANGTKSIAKNQARIVESGQHDLGVVPVLPVDHIPSKDKWSSPAMINDIAYLDRACANYASNLDAIIQDQTFSQLAMPAQNLMPGDEAHDKLIEMGTKRVFIYDGEGGKGPAYLSPDPRQAALIIDAIGQLINEIYHSVGLAGERTKQDNSKGIDNSSGVAKSKDFERVSALLVSKSDGLEVLENQMVDLVCLWSGEKPPEHDLVEYPDSFNVRDLYDEFNIAQKLALIGAPASMRASQMKSVVEKLFPSLGKKIKDKIYSDVDSWQSDLEKSHELELKSAEEQTSFEKKPDTEAKRDRVSSGALQSKTKSRQVNRQKQSQEKG